MQFFVRWIFWMALLLAPAAFAATPDGVASVPRHRLDVGLGLGVNTNSGFGLETDWRLDRKGHVSLGLDLGAGLSGRRLSVEMRGCPWAVWDSGFYVAGSATMNFGIDLNLKAADGTPQPISLLPTPTINLGLGYRYPFENGAWLLVRIGWSVRLRKNNVIARFDGAMDPMVAQAVRIIEPGGFVFGISGGFSVL